jgi:DNA-binding transcriptional regulator YiaG
MTEADIDADMKSTIDEINKLKEENKIYEKSIESGLATPETHETLRLNNELIESLKEKLKSIVDCKNDLVLARAMGIDPDLLLKLVTSHESMQKKPSGPADVMMKAIRDYKPKSK